MKILSFSHANLEIEIRVEIAEKGKSSLLPVTNNKKEKRKRKYSMLDYYYYQIISQQISPSLKNTAFASFHAHFIHYITYILFHDMAYIA